MRPIIMWIFFLNILWCSSFFLLWKMLGDFGLSTEDTPTMDPVWPLLSNTAELGRLVFFTSVNHVCFVSCPHAINKGSSSNVEWLINIHWQRLLIQVCCLDSRPTDTLEGSTSNLSIHHLLFPYHQFNVFLTSHKRLQPNSFQFLFKTTMAQFSFTFPRQTKTVCLTNWLWQTKVKT